MGTVCWSEVRIAFLDVGVLYVGHQGEPTGCPAGPVFGNPVLDPLPSALLEREITK